MNREKQIEEMAVILTDGDRRISTENKRENG